MGLDPKGSEGLLVNGTALAATLGAAAGSPVMVTKSDYLGNAMCATRTGEYVVFIAPAHIAALALAYGYDLIRSTARDETYVFVGRAVAKLPAALKGGEYLPRSAGLRRGRCGAGDC